MIEGVAAVVLVVALIVALPLMALWWMFDDWRKARADVYLRHEKELLAKGFPPHERCLCPRCREWRSHVDNMTRMERGQ